MGRGSEPDRETTESGFRQHGRALARLAQSKHLGGADVAPLLREVTETASGTLSVERVSVWLYENEKRAIRCVDLFEGSVAAHSAGVELQAADYPRYFESLETQRAIAAHDARTDARTAEFTGSYLTPLGITSMLDAPIRAGEDMVGVICLEHVGPARQWTREEQSFAASVADILALGFEMAERRRVSERMRLSEGRYRALAANFPNGAVLLYDRDLRFVVADGAGLAEVGLSTETLEGKTIWEALPADTCERIEPYYRAALAGEKGVFEMEFGSKLYRVHVVPVRDGGDVVAGLVMTQDVTEIRRAHEVLQAYSRTLEERVAERTRELREKQAQLVQSAKMASLGGLVAGIVHEINNPLGAMHGSNDVVHRSAVRIRDILEAAKGGLTDAQRAALAELAARIEDAEDTSRVAGARIASIVTSLKDFARLDSSSEAFVDVHSGIESAIALVQHMLEDRIELRREYADLPAVRCFPDKMNQAYMNVLLNAIQAIPERGEITVRTRAVGSAVEIAVTDTGVGIPRENLERIFDPGFTTKGVKVGTGLGLSIVHRIMEEHGGRVDVESAPGVGSTFRLRLPIERAVPGAGA